MIPETEKNFCFRSTVVGLAVIAVMDSKIQRTPVGQNGPVGSGCSPILHPKPVETDRGKCSISVCC